MKLSDINFGTRLLLEEHPRYPEFRRLMGLRDFAAYREVFERGWAETSIMCGENVRLDALLLSDQEPPSTPLVNLMGVNDHSPRRVRLAEEFLGEYDRLGRSRFLKESAYTTGYVQDLIAVAEVRTSGLKGIRGLLARRAQRKGVRYRIISYLNTYENMKRFGQLTGRAHTLHETPPPLEPHDLPWAIDYCGYIKLRDGAHRRAAAHYLGWRTIPTLVFEFNSTTIDDLAQAAPYIRENFDWFATLVRDTARLGSQMLSSPQ